MSAIEHLSGALADRYAIEREIGAGGMATVYLAQDLRHHRRVAIKVLKPELAAVLGTERFLGEIELTANLQHPHLLPLFDSGEVVPGGHDPGFARLLYYVMPYVEGETLRQRLTRERQLSVEEAIRITRAVASALDYAHRRGIIHRDLKPENILLLEGEPLVTDFGIALAVSKAAGERITQSGISLGTPQYMSPEQASGDRQLDARSDVYSLAAVLYEMLAGEPPHTGSTVQAVISKVIAEEPRPVDTLRKTVPANVSLALEKALAKVPADRFAAAGDLAAQLVSNDSQHLSARLATRARPSKQSTALIVRWLPWAVVIVLAGSLTVTLARKPDSDRRAGVLRAVFPIPPGAQPGEAFPITFSPDGKRLVYAATVSETTRLYLATLADADPKPMSGTEGADSPFFSPDGQWIGFFADGKLKKISVLGGLAFPIANASNSRGGWWGDNEVIVFAPDPYSGLFAVPASGGVPRHISTPDSARGETGHRYPQVLPGAQAVLYTAAGLDQEHTHIVLQSLATGNMRVIVRAASAARYAPTGHLVYSRGTTLFGVRFDEARLSVVGPEVPVVEDAYATTRTTPIGSLEFAVSAAGVLAYLSGGSQPTQTQLVWVDRKGNQQALSIAPQDYWYPRVSPDGRVVAVTARAAPSSDIWLYRLAGGELNKVTFDGANWYPTWAPTGTELAVMSVRATTQNIYRLAASGDRAAERLTTGRYYQRPRSWSPDGRLLAFVQIEPDTREDIWLLRTDGDRNPQPWLRTRFSETDPAFSPDGKWLAYSSDESGRREVYVQPVSGSGGKWLVSPDGGSQPLWSRDGRELFYVHGGDFVAVPVTTQQTFAKGASAVLFTVAFRGTFDVAPDGRFLIVKLLEPATIPELRVVVNWFDELRDRVPSR